MDLVWDSRQRFLKDCELRANPVSAVNVRRRTYFPNDTLGKLSLNQ